MKTCLVAVPLSEADAESQQRLDAVIDSLLVPALKACGYGTPPDRSYRLWMANWGPIGVRLVPEVVLEAVIDADLLIADLTGGDSSVRDQLALRRGTRRPTLQIAQIGETLPEYLSKRRTVFFAHHEEGADEQARQEIIQEIIAQIKQEEIGSTPKRSPIVIASA